MPKFHAPPIENYEARLVQLMDDYAAAQFDLLPEHDHGQRAVATECIKYQIADMRAAIEEIRLGIA